MKLSNLILVAVMAYLPSVAFAQTLVPATSEDIDAFDRQLAEARKDNFGKQVSEEAKKLKSTEKQERRDMGQFVSDQRRKEDQGRPDTTKASDNRNERAGNAGQNAADRAGNARGNSGKEGRGHNK
jgi:hypothetical protein